MQAMVLIDMFGWVEICLLSSAAVLLLLRILPYFRPYRPLFVGGSALMLITALFPRAGNPLGQFLFMATSGVVAIVLGLALQTLDNHAVATGARAHPVGVDGG